MTTKKIDFLIIGAQKSGTSALDFYLRQHPDIGMANGKELHFFDNEEIFSQEEVDYGILESQFNWNANNQCYGEATPIYMYWKPSIQRIWEYNQAIKLIAILRNPVERAFSHWNMEAGRNWEHEDFIHCIKNEQERSKVAQPLQHRVFSYVSRGFYSEQIKRIFTFFPSEQVLFIKYEDYLQDQETAITNILRFLGVDPGKYNFTPQWVLPGKYNRKITAEEKAFLLDIFHNDILEVERLLKWNCEDWKK